MKKNEVLLRGLGNADLDKIILHQGAEGLTAGGQLNGFIASREKGHFKHMAQTQVDERGQLSVEHVFIGQRREIARFFPEKINQAVPFAMIEFPIGEKQTSEALDIYNSIKSNPVNIEAVVATGHTVVYCPVYGPNTTK